MRYVSIEDYKTLYPIPVIPEEEQMSQLCKAECDIDSLTYNRIYVKGFDGLTGFQQDIVKRVICEQANFSYECADMLSNPLASYSINGVSMSFDNKKVLCMNGVHTLNGIYALLRQTGLIFRGVR